MSYHIWETAVYSYLFLEDFSVLVQNWILEETHKGQQSFPAFLDARLAQQLEGDLLSPVPLAAEDLWEEAKNRGAFQKLKGDS